MTCKPEKPNPFEKLKTAAVFNKSKAYEIKDSSERECDRQTDRGNEDGSHQREREVLRATD